MNVNKTMVKLTAAAVLAGATAAGCSNKKQEPKDFPIIQLPEWKDKSARLDTVFWDLMDSDTIIAKALIEMSKNDITPQVKSTIFKNMCNSHGINPNDPNAVRKVIAAEDSVNNMY